MKWRSTFSFRIFLFLLLAVTAGCDQVSKRMVRNSIPQNAAFTYLDKHITLTRVENSGAFFGLGESSHGKARWLFLIVLPAVFLLAGIIWLYKRNTGFTGIAIGVSLLIGGGLGNLIDRLRYGSVTDFLHLNLFFFQTGIFNIADMAIMAGMTILIINSLKKEKAAEVEPPDQHFIS
jgi:signal peptidase II